MQKVSQIFCWVNYSLQILPGEPPFWGDPPGKIYDIHLRIGPLFKIGHPFPADDYFFLGRNTF
jgi:hypothetical protein